MESFPSKKGKAATYLPQAPNVSVATPDYSVSCHSATGEKSTAGVKAAAFQCSEGLCPPPPLASGHHRSLGSGCCLNSKKPAAISMPFFSVNQPISPSPAHTQQCADPPFLSATCDVCRSGSFLKVPDEWAASIPPTVTASKGCSGRLRGYNEPLSVKYMQCP